MLEFPHLAMDAHIYVCSALLTSTTLQRNTSSLLLTTQELPDTQSLQPIPSLLTGPDWLASSPPDCCTLEKLNRGAPESHQGLDMSAVAEERQITLDMESVSVERTEVSETHSKTSRTWRLCVGIAALALCAAVAMLFTWQMQKPDDQMEGNDLKHTLRQLSQRVKAAIHLQGEYNPEFSQSSVEWRVGDGQSFSQGGLTLENNEVVIPQAGLYFVYSQASFRVNCRADAEEANQYVHVSHAVERWSDQYDSWQPLLSAVRSACKRVVGGPDSGERFYSAVYLGAIFYLEEGDKLRTDTPPKLLTNVEGEDGKTFFGVFAL